MGFFDFLFGKTKDEPIQGVSSIDQVVKESVEHLEKCIGKVTLEKLEAEAINLASYIYLRKGGKIDFKRYTIGKGEIKTFIFQRLINRMNEEEKARAKITSTQRNIIEQRTFHDEHLLNSELGVLLRERNKFD